MKQLEVCCADINSVYAAIDGGASRIELCTGLSEGGTTPSPAMIEAAVDSGIPVHVLIRPRSGDFVYNDAEKKIILADIRHARRIGVRAVVIGALTSSGDIDECFLSECLKEADGIRVTFHRAFDCCKNPFKAIDTLIKYGVDYILTSGLAESASMGAAMLQQLNVYAGNKIKIIAAAGISSKNIVHIASVTGCDEFHASARARHNNQSIGLFPDFIPTDATEVAAIMKQLQSL